MERLRNHWGGGFAGKKKKNSVTKQQIKIRKSTLLTGNRETFGHCGGNPPCWEGKDLKNLDKTGERVGRAGFNTTSNPGTKKGNRTWIMKKKGGGHFEGDRREKRGHNLLG